MEHGPSGDRCSWIRRWSPRPGAGRHRRDVVARSREVAEEPWRSTSGGRLDHFGAWPFHRPRLAARREWMTGANGGLPVAPDPT